ncbi:dihydropteroate synthase [Nocardioides sp.]|uniref:dihydropteroate synthase n=1 Tax=Nocardioides sp. TaxID=35761 RepID=UPI002B265DEA|nr:dihydropteroate synthase [Nocardioides sp.]
MISLRRLVDLATAHADDLDHAVEPLRLGTRTFDTDTEPVVMGVVNLSRDSTYRESVATSTANAVRRGRVLAAQGAHLIDVGAESTNVTKARVDADQQIRSLVPVIEALAADDIAVSIESYAAPTVRAGLEAGARALNLTGSDDDAAMFDLAAEYDAAVVLCHVYGAHARDLDTGRDPSADTDPVPEMLERFEQRIGAARAAGVTSLSIDPGVGFSFRTDDPLERSRHQASVLLNSFRLRRLGVPICHSVPHSFDLFEEQFRIAESFYTVLANLGGTGVYRTHEVPQIVAVLGALHAL